MLELSQQTEELARRLAQEKAQPIDAIVRAALEASVKEGANLPTRKATQDVQAWRRAALDRAIAAIAALPELDGRSSEDIMDDLDPL